MKILRACTVPQSLCFVTGMLPELQEKYDVTLLSSSGPEWESIREQYPDVKCVEVNMERHIAPFKDLKSLWRLWRVFRREKPQMVHSMTPKAGLLCMMAAKFAGVPIRVHTFTGLVWPSASGVKRRVLMATDWLTCSCATHVLPEGKGVMNDLRNCITKKPMRVLGYGNVQGVDMERFNPARFVSRKAAGIFTYVFVGRIVGDKGINELIAAFVRLHDRYQQTRLILVGKYEEQLDPIRKETQDAIDNNDAIIAVGPKYGDDLLQMYMDSDCFVMPSYREGFPNTVLEAGAMGLPSVVTDINGSREIILDGENGIIVPSKDIDRLQEAMEKMLTDGTSRSAMAKKARPLIELRFEKGFVQQCLLDFYSEILK